MLCEDKGSGTSPSRLAITDAASTQPLKMESDMKVLSVSWNPDKDVTKIKFNDEFLSSDWTVRADVLKDLIVDLTDMYEEMLSPNKEED
jgi:hypothetical protein